MATVIKMPSPREINEKFKRATAYAKQAMRQPAARQYYASVDEWGRTAYNNALADYLHAPEINAVFTKQYTGLAGSKIIILAQDDCRVHTVFVSIISSAGLLIEDGEATAGERCRKWTYTAQHNHDSLSGTHIVVTAHDLAGNTRTLQITLP